MSDLSFDAAVQLIREGQSVSDVTSQLVACLSTPEKLSVLTGPLTFWPGIKALFVGGLNKGPYILGAVDRLGIPGIRFCDGPRGVVLGEATCFPIAMARGATWDVALEERVGAVMAVECRAKGANTSGSICINLPRHPAWGRIQETYGEDPLLLGEFGLALTRALQDGGVMACVKHFALNSMENARFHVDVTIDEASLHEVFLPHFEMAVREGRAMSVMSAYNSVNGEWCGQNDMLLNRVLRDMWGFKYFTISDWVFGLRDSSKSILNGLDLEAPFAQIRSNLQKELNAGLFTMANVEESASRLISSQLELYSKRTITDPESNVVLCGEHRDLSREVAAKSMVLLKNEAIDGTNQPLLPIDETKVKKCAVIGQLADAKNTGDWGSSYVNSPHIVTPYEGIKAALPEATVTLTASDSPVEAAKAAREADFALVVVGYGAMDEGENLSGNNPASLIPIPSLIELVRDALPTVFQVIKGKLGLGGSGLTPGGKSGGDRKSLRLPPRNLHLINAVRQASPKTVVAIIASGAVIMEDWIDNVESVLINWYSGCEGGHALADVLLGRVDASGRLPFSIPKSEDDLPFFDISAKTITYDKWFGQRLLDKKGVTARYPLGHGCSYTSFQIGGLRVEQQKDIISIEVEVTNTGSRDGRHILQAYGLPLGAGEDFPLRVLLGFKPVDLQTGETKKVHIAARTNPLKRFRNGEFVLASHEVEIEVGAFAGDRASFTKLEFP